MDHNVDAMEKILKVAQEIYEGWRATLRDSFEAYNSYDERMKHQPKGLDTVEWHYLIMHFGSSKFKVTHNKSLEVLVFFVSSICLTIVGGNFSINMQ